ncbi:MAG: dephospho-CoA kinase [Phycisphaerales bacterium]|nr:dephospho-CoA kinase [Phycisphaerales bacterium]
MSDPSIPIIGLMGGIGSGKSQVAALLRECGCVVADADKMAKEALETPTVRDALRERWGEDVFTKEGLVDRKAVAKIVFKNASERVWLESIIHPIVEATRSALFSEADPRTPALVIDAPLLLEAGLAEGCDSILFVDAPEKMRQKRLQETRGWDAEEMERREAAQIPLDEKRSISHHVLRNDGKIEDLARSVEDYLDSLINDHSSHPGD